MNFHLTLQAYLLGWTVAAPIGPVNLEIIRRSLRHRLLAGFMVGLGATMIDLTYMLLASFGLAGLLQQPAFLMGSLITGGTLLALLGVLAVRDGFRQWKGQAEAKAQPQSTTEKRDRKPLLKSWLTGLAMTAANPMTIVFWAALPALFYHGTQPGPLQILQLAGFVWFGTISWVTLLICILAVARQFAGPRLFAVASFTGGLAMLYFAARFWWLAIQY